MCCWSQEAHPQRLHRLTTTQQYCGAIIICQTKFREVPHHTGRLKRLTTKVKLFHLLPSGKTLWAGQTTLQRHIKVSLSKEHFGPTLATGLILRARNGEMEIERSVPTWVTARVLIGHYLSCRLACS